MHVSYTQLAAVTECERRWQLSRKYEVRSKAKALAEGELMHLVLGKFYGTRTDTHAYDTIGAYQKELEVEGREDIEELSHKFDVLTAVAYVYWNKIAQNDLSVFAIEHIELPFDMMLAPGIMLHGYIDGIWRHIPTGVRFIVEHKYKQEHRDELMPLDLQTAIYTLAMMPKYGHIPTLYNVLKKPQLRLGKKETAEEFLLRLKAKFEEGVTWDATEIQSDYFIRRRYTRGRRELAAALANAREMAFRMIDLTHRPERVIRNVGDQCVYWCPFRSICIDEDPLLVLDRYVERVVDGGDKKPVFKI